MPAPRQGASRKHGFPRLAPTLWNLFYEDAWRAIHEAGFVEIVNADDSNGFREFEHNASADSIIAEAKKCQPELHNCCGANQVTFDPAKECVHIVSHAQPHGDSLKLLGVPFDCMLRMDLAVSEVVGQASWKLTTILWARRLHDVPQLVQVYTSKVPSFVEYRTPAVCHATKSTLPGIDAVQKRFLRECGLSDEDALLHLNLAPLETRRDIAMLGLLHQPVLGIGPRQDERGGDAARTADAPEVLCVLRKATTAGFTPFSPRVPLAEHPLHFFLETSICVVPC